MEASAEEKFDAAVQVIQSIPKNVSIRDVIRLGAFQPSNSLLLRFYGYYKQATTGPCNIPRPAFYDVIGRTKWDTWNKLGDMSKEDAMNCYVEELKNIIEAMPHTDKVSVFISKLGNFYELVDEKIGEDYRKIKPALHLNGDVSSKKLTSHSITTHPTKETSNISGSTECQFPEKTTTVNDKPQSEHVKEHSEEIVTEYNKVSDTPTHDVRKSVSERVTDTPTSDDDSEVDEFCDTFDSPQISDVINPSGHHDDHSYNLLVKTSLQHNTESENVDCETHQLSEENWSIQDQRSSSTQQTPGVSLVKTETYLTEKIEPDFNSRIQDKSTTSTPLSVQSPVTKRFEPENGLNMVQRVSDISEQLAVTINQLQVNMKSVHHRLEVLERHQAMQQRQRSSLSWWWPFVNMPKKTVLFFIIWPFVVHWWLMRRRMRVYHQ